MDYEIGLEIFYDIGHIIDPNVCADMPAAPRRLGLTGAAEPQHLMPASETKTPNALADESAATGNENFHDH